MNQAITVPVTHFYVRLYIVRCPRLPIVEEIMGSDSSYLTPQSLSHSSNSTDKQVAFGIQPL